MIRRRTTTREAPGEAYESPVHPGPGGAKKARPDNDSCCTRFISASIAGPEGPSTSMMALLCNRECINSQQLYSAIAAGARELSAAGPTGADSAMRSVQGRLQEMHSCIVALDDKLEEHYAKPEDTAGLESCRQWLKQTQGYVLHLQNQVAAFPSDGHSTSSMDDASSTSSNSTTAGTAGDLAWRALCQDAADCLARVAQHMAAAGSLDVDTSWGQQQQRHLSAAAAQHGARLVAGRSCLSYSQFWSKKIAL